jgi:phenylacetate-coenzyme A ligase PaaK-like adenylate-forming protein
MKDKELQAREVLFKYKKIYDFIGSEQLFLNAVKESVRYHQVNNPVYHKLLDSKGFTAEDVKDMKDLDKIPSVPVDFYKTHELMSISPDKIEVHATSSGTLGQKSQVFLSKRDIELGTKMMIKSMWHHRFISLTPTNYLLLGYEPKKGNNMGNVKVLLGMTKLAPAKEIVFAIRALGDDYQIDYFGIIKSLERFSKQPFPVRIFGFPGYLYMLLSTMKSMDIPPLRLNKKSIIFTGGGWKKMSNLSVTKEKLHALVEEMLGIPAINCRDFYSAVEHSVAYPECKYHHMHVPIWSRVIIRDIKTLENVGFNQPGFLSFVSPLVSGVPITAVTMGDLAILKDGSTCGCGITTPYFEILGRAGTVQRKSCAVSASELMERGQYGAFI